MDSHVIVRRLAITSAIVAAVVVAYEAAWVLTGQYGGVGGVLDLAACLLAGLLIPIRFILLPASTPKRRAIGLSVYLVTLWGIWIVVWGRLTLDYPDGHELERWQTTLLFYSSTIGLPLLTAVSIGAWLVRIGNGQWSQTSPTEQPR